MSVTIESTDTPEQVLAAIGNASAKESKEKPVAASEQSEKAETADDSGASENELAEAKASDLDSEEEEHENEEGSKDEDKPKKPLKGFKKRIDKLSKRLSQTESDVQYWKQEALKNQKQPEAKPEPKAEVIAEGKPKAGDFDTHEEYVEKLAEWKSDQRWKENENKQREAQFKTEQQKLVSSYQAKMKALKDEHKDADDIIESVSDILVPPVVQQILLESENGHQLSYELAKNRDEFERICKLSPIAAARELGKFEAGLKPSKASEQIKTTKAPAPISPVGSKGSNSSKNPDEMDFQAFKKWREKSA